MKIFVKAKPFAREEKVEKIDETHFRVSVEEASVKGRANIAIIKALAKYFNIPPTSVKITRGAKTPNKIIEIIDLK